MTTLETAKAFWHIPAGDKEYHFFGTNGQSKCGKWGMVGFGLPTDATVRRPKRACKGCAKNLDRID